MPDFAPNPEVLLAFDFGLRHIGVAVGQIITQSATPLEILIAQQGIPNWDKLKQLINVWRPGALVVGIPYQMDGSEQTISIAAREFAHSLEKHFDLPVHKVDERLTTREAKLQLANIYVKHKSFPPLDSYAAKLILEAWFSLC